MNKIFIGVVFIFIFPYKLSAQQREKNLSNNWFIGAGAFVDQVYNIDKKYGSLTYSGINAGGSLRLLHNNQNTIHYLDFSYSAGNLKAKKDFAGSINNNYACFDYMLLFKIKSTGNSFLKCSMGGAVNAFYTNRKYNAVVNKNTSFESAISVGFSCNVQHSFSNGFSLFEQLSVPLLSYTIQPPFGNENASDKQSLNDKTLTSFSSFLRIKNCLGINKDIDDHQKLSLSYSWDYYRINETLDVINANHGILLTYYHSL